METAVRNPTPRADAFATNHTGGVPFETLKALSELSAISQSRFVSDRRQSDLDSEFFRLALNDEFPALDDDELILHGIVKLVRVLDLSIPARRRLAYEIIKNYARIVGRGANQLTKVEHHALRRLKEWTEP